MWVDSSCEEYFCSTQEEALEFAREFLREYEGRISCISITSPQGTFEVVIDQRSHLDSVEPSSMVSRSA
jgi:hypothetical protein